MDSREKLLGLKKEYNSIEVLIENNPSKETAEAKAIFEKYNTNHKNGHFTKDLLFQIAYWKSPRKAYLCKINTKKIVNKTIKEIFEMNNEKERITNLVNKLWGVRIPVASAILTIIDPKNYGLIDYKVWQILYLYGCVEHKPFGRNLSVRDWLLYLELVRKFAKKLKISVRDVDRTLFDYHKKLELLCKSK